MHDFDIYPKLPKLEAQGGKKNCCGAKLQQSQSKAVLQFWAIMPTLGLGKKLETSVSSFSGDLAHMEEKATGAKPEREELACLLVRC